MGFNPEEEVRPGMEYDATNFVDSLTDNKTDPKLGKRVEEHLVKAGLETPRSNLGYNPKAAVAALTNGIEATFRHLGLDNGDPSLADTPRRYACMLVGELTSGLDYNRFPKCTTVPNGKLTPELAGSDMSDNQLDSLAKGAYNQMVLVRKIQTISLCEHHLQTIDGYTHIAYIPTTKVLGLSKFARVVDFFARRPQIQERFTEQVYAALNLILETDDIAVICTATHFCMKARGALQHAADTTTDKMGGRFMTNSALREELNARIRA